MWPITSRSFGKRSNAPEKISAHRVQPHVVREAAERAEEPAALVMRRVERRGRVDVERRVVGFERLEDRANTRARRDNGPGSAS